MSSYHNQYQVRPLPYPFFDKSKINLDAAENLNKASLYAPSVHCCYYSVFQYMLHVLSTKSTNEWHNYLEDIKKDTHSHVTLINIINKMLRQTNPQDFKYFDQKLTELKKMRIRADYSDDIVKQEDATGSLTIADSLRTVLKDNFK